MQSSKMFNSTFDMTNSAMSQFVQKFKTIHLDGDVSDFYRAVENLNSDEEVAAITQGRILDFSNRSFVFSGESRRSEYEPTSASGPVNVGGVVPMQFDLHKFDFSDPMASFDEIIKCRNTIQNINHVRDLVDPIIKVYDATVRSYNELIDVLIVCPTGVFPEKILETIMYADLVSRYRYVTFVGPNSAAVNRLLKERNYDYPPQLQNKYDIIFIFPSYQVSAHEIDQYRSTACGSGAFQTDHLIYQRLPKDILYNPLNKVRTGVYPIALGNTKDIIIKDLLTGLDTVYSHPLEYSVSGSFSTFIIQNKKDYHPFVSLENMLQKNLVMDIVHMMRMKYSVNQFLPGINALDHCGPVFEIDEDNATKSQNFETTKVFDSLTDADLEKISVNKCLSNTCNDSITYAIINRGRLYTQSGLQFKLKVWDGKDLYRPDYDRTIKSRLNGHYIGYTDGKYFNFLDIVTLFAPTVQNVPVNLGYSALSDLKRLIRNWNIALPAINFDYEATLLYIRSLQNQRFVTHNSCNGSSTVARVPLDRSRKFVFGHHDHRVVVGPQLFVINQHTYNQWIPCLAAEGFFPGVFFSGEHGEAYSRVIDLKYSEIIRKFNQYYFEFTDQKVAGDYMNELFENFLISQCRHDGYNRLSLGDMGEEDELWVDAHEPGTTNCVSCYLLCAMRVDVKMTTMYSNFITTTKKWVSDEDFMTYNLLARIQNAMQNPGVSPAFRTYYEVARMIIAPRFYLIKLFHDAIPRDDIIRKHKLKFALGLNFLIHYSNKAIFFSRKDPLSKCLAASYCSPLWPFAKGDQFLIPDFLLPFAWHSNFHVMFNDDNTIGTDIVLSRSDNSVAPDMLNFQWDALCDANSRWNEITDMDWSINCCLPTMRGTSDELFMGRNNPTNGVLNFMVGMDALCYKIIFQNLPATGLKLNVDLGQQ